MLDMQSDGRHSSYILMNLMRCCCCKGAAIVILQCWALLLVCCNAAMLHRIAMSRLACNVCCTAVCAMPGWCTARLVHCHTDGGDLLQIPTILKLFFQNGPAVLSHTAVLHYKVHHVWTALQRPA